MMWRLRTFLSLAFCILSVRSAPAAMPTASQNFSQRKAPSDAATVSEFIATCDGVLWGCEYKMRQAVLNNINTRDAASICLTDAHPRTRVMAWLKAHPETYNMATEDGLYTSYKSLYRCP
jgi:hypothetical protein